MLPPACLLLISQCQHWITHNISDLQGNYKFGVISVTSQKQRAQWTTRMMPPLFIGAPSSTGGSVYNPRWRSKVFPRDRGGWLPRILGKASFQRAQEAQSVVPCGSFLRFIHSTITKGRVSDRSRIGRPLCSKIPRGLYTSPLIPGITKTPASFAIFPARSIAPQDNSESHSPFYEGWMRHRDASPCSTTFAVLPEQKRAGLIKSVGSQPLVGEESYWPLCPCGLDVRSFSWCGDDGWWLPVRKVWSIQCSQTINSVVVRNHYTWKVRFTQHLLQKEMYALCHVMTTGMRLVIIGWW